MGSSPTEHVSLGPVGPDSTVPCQLYQSLSPESMGPSSPEHPEPEGPETEVPRPPGSKFVGPLWPAHEPELIKTLCGSLID